MRSTRRSRAENNSRCLRRDGNLDTTTTAFICTRDLADVATLIVKWGELTMVTRALVQVVRVDTLLCAVVEFE